jgi:hypothetical protein
VCILHANGSNDKVNYVRDNWLKQLEVGWTENFKFKVRERMNVFVTNLGPAVDCTKPPMGKPAGTLFLCFGFRASWIKL